MRTPFFLVFLFLLSNSLPALSNRLTTTVSGKIIAAKGNSPIAFATVYLPSCELWAVTDDAGEFTIRQVPLGIQVVEIQCLGYAKERLEVRVTAGMLPLKVSLREDNLKLDEVVVMARKQTDAVSTAYTIDRKTLDHAQLLNIGDLGSLLPGGKTYNGSLLTDRRLALRTNSHIEKGNAGFGTAIEVDGIRLQTNAEMEGTYGAETRNIGTANIESVEVITGMPSVEYGDLSNGMVKINMRRGRSPWIIDMATAPHTKSIAMSKGYAPGNTGEQGVFNTSLEHTRSIGNLASPHTSYVRNALSVSYAHTLFPQRNPLSLQASVMGNIGGYDSSADPDALVNTYSRLKDRTLRASLKGDWLLNKPWITNLSLITSFSYAHKLHSSSQFKSSASTLPYLHTLHTGYYVATEFSDEHSDAPILLSPTGYWYEQGFEEDIPVNYALKLKATWARNIGSLTHRLLVGSDYTANSNRGRGIYYTDMKTAPTWRPYRYDALPALHNWAFFAEEKLILPLGERQLEVQAGVRAEMSHVESGQHPTVWSVSPRLNARFHLVKNRGGAALRGLSVYGGIGKGVKLPSFEILNPSPSYFDRLVFSPGSTPDGKAFYAYHTHVIHPTHNSDLRWQYNRQIELGIEGKLWGTRFTLSGFYNRTYRSYMRTATYVPFIYKQTTQREVEQSSIPFANHQYSIDKATGVVTVTDRTGALPSETLVYTERQTYQAGAKFVNASPVNRIGVEWAVDFAPIRSLHTSFRIDGHYYRYEGTDETLIASSPGLSQNMADGRPYRYIGYYVGSDSYSTAYSATGSVANGSLSQRLNTNFTVKTHIPALRLLLSLKLEASFLQYSRLLSRYGQGTMSVASSLPGGSDAETYHAGIRGKYVSTYPLYYSTWEAPDVKLPFAERLAWAKTHDTALYNELSKLIKTSNLPYRFDPERISPYFSANLSVSKELGDFATLSFYANNFFNHLGSVKSSQTGLEQPLYGSGYVPSFYYGLSLKLKL